jgi:hypothetical protein
MSTLSKKFLAGLGIDDDKADLICERHKEVLNEIITERDEFKEKAEKYDDAQTQLNKYKEAEKEAEKNGEKNPYKVKYDALKEEFENYKNDISAKETKSKKESAYRQLLKDAGISEKRIDAVLKVSDIDSIEFDDEGKVKDADKIKTSIKEEWSDFIQTTQTKGASIPNPPSGSNNAVKSREEILKIKDTAERQEAWKSYIEANNKGA